MSRSRPTTQSPVTYRVQWSGGAEKYLDDKKNAHYEGGKLTHWDKEAEESEEIDFPFNFLVLDELATVVGFNQADNSGYYSNEVRFINDEEFIVKGKNGVIARGLWANIKDALKAKGGKYATSIYFAYRNAEDELEIGNMKLSGAALSAWMDFKKKVDVEKAAVSLTGSDGPHKNGTVFYFKPVFESIEVSTEANRAADVLDEKLQSFLDVNLSRQKAVSANDYPPDEDAGAEDIHNIKGVDDIEIEDTHTTMQPDGEITKDEEAPRRKERVNSGDKDIKLKNVKF